MFEHNLKFNLALLVLFLFLGCKLDKSSKGYIVVNGFNSSSIYVNLIDSAGNDYLTTHHIKPDEVHVAYTDGVFLTDVYYSPVSLFQDNFYLFRLDASNTDLMMIEIGSRVVDTVFLKDLNIYGVYYKSLHGDDYVDPYFGDTIEKFTLLKEVYYNNRRLAPPQFDADGNVHVHRIVVREDF